MDRGERRRAERRVPNADEPLRRIRSRTGHQFEVVNVSDTGVLVESVTRLLPNTHVDVHIITRGGRVLVRCRVGRAWVCHVEAELIRYRVALTYDRTVDTGVQSVTVSNGPGGSATQNAPNVWNGSNDSRGVVGYAVPGSESAGLAREGSAYPVETTGSDAQACERADV